MPCLKLQETPAYVCEDDDRVSDFKLLGHDWDWNILGSNPNDPKNCSVVYLKEKKKSAVEFHFLRLSQTKTLTSFALTTESHYMSLTGRCIIQSG